jgi:hypothetical protein
MSELTLFVQMHGRPSITEIIVTDGVTERQLHEALVTAGISLEADALIFIDEREEPLRREGDQCVSEIKSGHRVHVSRCRRIAVTVNFLEKHETREFAPGTRVRAVKAWSVKQFGLDHKDAAEHVLQRCGSTDRPTSDTPLHTLLKGDCALCFDLVPEKRVEG